MPALQGTLVLYIILHISQSLSSGKCVYRLCRALGAFVYFDITRRFFCLLREFLSDRPVEDDVDDELDVESWLVDGEGSSAPAAAEGRPPRSWAEGCPSLELVMVEWAAGLASSSPQVESFRAAKINGTS